MGGFPIIIIDGKEIYSGPNYLYVLADEETTQACIRRWENLLFRN